MFKKKRVMIIKHSKNIHSSLKFNSHSWKTFYPFLLPNFKSKNNFQQFDKSQLDYSQWIQLLIFAVRSEVMSNLFL